MMCMNLIVLSIVLLIIVVVVSSIALISFVTGGAEVELTKGEAIDKALAEIQKHMQRSE